MTKLLVHLVVSALLLVLVSQFVNGIRVDGFLAAMLAAIVLGFANGVVRPLLVLVTLPITLLTLGLFLFVVNALMLMLAAALVPGFSVDGFGAAFLGAILLALFNLVASAILNK